MYEYVYTAECSHFYTDSNSRAVLEILGTRVQDPIINGVHLSTRFDNKTMVKCTNLAYAAGSLSNSNSLKCLRYLNDVLCTHTCRLFNIYIAHTRCIIPSACWDQKQIERQVANTSK